MGRDCESAFTSPVRGSTIARPPMAVSVGRTWSATDASAASCIRRSIVVWMVRPPDLMSSLRSETVSPSVLSW